MNKFLTTLYSITLLIQAHTLLSTAQETSTGTTNTITTTQKTFQIYHSFGQNKPFLPRGTITLSTTTDTATDSTNSSDETTSNNKDNSDIITTVENNDDCLGVNAIQDMDELVSNNGFYRIKIVDEENENSILASVPGCEVKRANFR